MISVNAMLALLLASGFAVAGEGEEEVAPQPSEHELSQQNGAAMMDGFCHFQGFYLNDPVTSQPLLSRYVEIIIVNGEVDPPFSEGDDHVQENNDFYNTGSHRNWLNRNPGLIEAMVTVRAERPDDSDNRCQLWEHVILRAFNSDDKLTATHYVDSELWECPPGYLSVTPEQLKMGEWIDLSKKETP